MALCGVHLAACARLEGAASPVATTREVVFTTSSGARAQLDVGVADSSDERERGLMGVEDLGPNEGMAFVFDEPADGTFWMKETLIPLSIAFVDDAGTIVTVLEMEPCDVDPCPTYGADAPYVLAVEANEGYFDRMGIDEGHRARLEQLADA